jgi:xylulokinase
MPHGSAFRHLAMTGTGEYSSVREACRAAIREVRTCEPQEEEQKVYAEGYRIYRSLYLPVNAALRGGEI